MFPYRIVVEWSQEDGCYVSRVPALPGCMAHGDSPEEAVKEAQVGAEGILEVMEETGRSIPPPDATATYSGKLNVRMMPALHRELATIAAAQGVSLNHVINAVLARGTGLSVGKPPRKAARPAEKRGRRARTRRAGSSASKGQG